MQRGTDGVLSAGEFRLVDWDEVKCLRAAFSENNERLDLSPVDEGCFLNQLAVSLGNPGEPLSDEVLHKKTGLVRPRIT